VHNKTTDKTHDVTTVNENWLPHLLSYVKCGTFSNKVTATLASIDDIKKHITWPNTQLATPGNETICSTKLPNPSSVSLHFIHCRRQYDKHGPSTSRHLVTSMDQSRSLQLYPMVVSSTTATCKPLTYLVMGFAVSNVANIFILIILHDVCFLPKNYDQPELYFIEILNFIFFRSLNYSEPIRTVPVCKRMV
jgi:hypothetical protein